MADHVRVKKGDHIRMGVSLSGKNPETDEDVAYSPDQVLLVGTDIGVDQAAALVNEPEDDPRASLMDGDEGKRVRAEQRSQIEQNTQQANETPRPAAPPEEPLDQHVGEVSNEETAQARRDLEQALSSGELSLAGLFAAVDEEEGQEHRPAGHMHLRAAIVALPEIGEVKAAEILEQLGVEAERHLDALGSRQREELASLVDHAVAGDADPADTPEDAAGGDPDEEKEGDAEVGEEQRSGSEEEQAERATSPEAETRETATPKRGRKKVEPPDET